MFFKKKKKGAETPEYKATVTPPTPRVFDTLPDARKVRMLSHVFADKKSRERKEDAFSYLLHKMEEYCKGALQLWMKMRQTQLTANLTVGVQEKRLRTFLKERVIELLSKKTTNQLLKR